jgi:hypothetical protein
VIRPVTVAVRLSLRVDAEAWRHEYGVEPENVRDDVRAYVTNAVLADLRDRGLLIDDGAR